jgi:hypothetical protein
VKQGLLQHLDFDEVGELTEYVGCNIERNEAEGLARLTQPVLYRVYSYSDG